MIVALVVFVLYFLPSFIAGFRRHRNTGAIFALDLLLGWTLLGWVAALVWSLTWQPPREQPTTRMVALAPPAQPARRRPSILDL